MGRTTVLAALVVVAALFSDWLLRAATGVTTTPADAVVGIAAALVALSVLALLWRQTKAALARVQVSTRKVTELAAEQEIARLRQQDQRDLEQWTGYLRDQSAHRHLVLMAALERAASGDAPEPTLDQVGPSSGPLAALTQQLRVQEAEALARVAELAQRVAPGEATMFVTVAQRLHALVMRLLDALSGAEGQVEDPELLHDLFKIDHLATRLRRAIESLALLGGQNPRRVRQALDVALLLRTAVQEIENYPRVRVVATRPGIAVLGHAGPAVVHLLAELAENAAAFSPPDSQVLMRAQAVPAGLAIEIEDRGLRIDPVRRDQFNRLLAQPDRVAQRALFRGGHLGLLVVSQIAQRYGITVRLGDSVYGGTVAVVVLPPDLLTAPTPPGSSPVAAPQPSSREPFPHGQPVTAVPAFAPRQPVASAPASSPAGPDGRPTLPQRNARAPRRQVPVIPAAPRGAPTAGLAAAFTSGRSQGRDQLVPQRADRPEAAAPEPMTDTTNDRGRV
ncbi:ATP-binding protein [Streptacidiphilus fuscans]|uniref:histidine kinase n=1 Tax=Streptacidiphilus fuscans TaxID=2789292 RepID=A0A931B7V8_9ACTN|nr:ATP-binding protein [Streptacidiphilus fuscans]MBF9071833.1 hypothetical protein [Streptacidiphilus fuscans]